MQVTACAPGTYSGRILLTAAADDSGNSIRGCVACPAGYMCADTPTFTPVACTAGTWSAASATQCEQCPDGSYCAKDAMTDSDPVTIEDGFYYTGGAGLAIRPYHISSQFSCPPGYWCANNQKTACVAGTYQPLYGQTSDSACLQTPAGYYTEEAATNFFDTPCPAGLYCLAGSINGGPGCNLADCPSGWAINCPAGTFRQHTGAR